MHGYLSSIALMHGLIFVMLQYLHFHIGGFLKMHAQLTCDTIEKLLHVHSHKR